MLIIVFVYFYKMPNGIIIRVSGVQVPLPIPSKPSKIIAHERYELIILFDQYVIKPKLDKMI